MTTLDASKPEDRAKLAKMLGLSADGSVKSKFNNKRTEIDGVKFHSKREGLRYQDLKQLERAGEITELERQVRLPLLVLATTGQRESVGDYIADFRYFDNRKGQYIYEDSKGCRTDLYELKKKIVEAAYGIKLLET